MSKLVQINERIANSVVSGYRRIEKEIVNGFQTFTDKCVKILFAKEGENIEEAKARLQKKAD